jgi:hypothetical protein
MVFGCTKPCTNPGPCVQGLPVDVASTPTVVVEGGRTVLEMGGGDR